jgi:hypothetical protein
MRFDGVDGASESRSAPSVSEIVVTKDMDSLGGMDQFSWGLDRIDMSADAFFAYGDGFLGGVDVPVASAGIIRLEIIYAPLGAPDPVDGLVVEVPGLEAKGPHMLMTAGFMF